MHVFYTPDIQTSTELPEEEAQHCVRVLRRKGKLLSGRDQRGNP